MLAYNKSTGSSSEIAIPPNSTTPKLEEVIAYPTEGELWQSFKAGNEKAFAYIYNKYVHALYNYGYHITPQRESVEDCIQDLFIELWHNRQTLGHTDAIKFYLYKALKRKLIKKIVIQKKHFLYTVLVEEAYFNPVLSPEFEIIACQVTQEQKNNLLAALNNLTQHQKEAIILKFYHELSYQQVASILAMSVKGTYNLIYRAIDILKTHVDKILCILCLSHLY